MHEEENVNKYQVHTYHPIRTFIDTSICITIRTFVDRYVNKGGHRGNRRIEGAAGQRRRAALLLPHPPSFRKLLTPLIYISI